MKLAYEPINENEISIREINLNDTRKIGYYYGIDKIHLYTPVQNTEIPQKLFREISRKKKVIDWVGYRIKRYNDSQLYLNISFSPSKLCHGTNLYSEVSIDSLSFIVPAELKARKIEIKNWQNIFISRLDLYSNLITDGDYSKYDATHKALNFKNTNQWLVESTVYLYNESFRIAIYDKTEEVKKKNPNVRIDHNVTRVEFRLLNKKKIISSLGAITDPKTRKPLKVFPFCMLSETQINTCLETYLEKLTQSISNFNFQPKSDILENELISFFTKTKSRKPGVVAQRKAREALHLFEVYKSDSYLDFLRNNPEYSKVKKITKKRLKEYIFLKNKFVPLLSAAILIDHQIYYGTRYIKEFNMRCRDEKSVALF